MLLFLLDIHRNILSVQGFIRYTSDCISKIQVILKTNSVCVEFYNDTSLYRSLTVLMPDNFIQPCTVSSICCQNSTEQFLSLEDNIVKMYFPCSNRVTSNDETRRTEATFRFQLHNNNVIDECILKISNPLYFREFMLKKLEKYESFYIFCTNCGGLLSDKAINIKSIQKYYEGMTDSAETWFCHKHGDHKSVDNSTESLYISDMHFYFHSTTLNSLKLFEDNKCFKCIKCLSNLSFKKKMNKPHFIGFFADKIMLEKSETNSGSLQQYKKDIALFAFCSVVQDPLNFADFCNLYLQCKVDEKVEVLLLRFNSLKVVQFLLHQENDEELPREMEFKTKEVFKVLFCVCSPDSELSRKWKHDFSVDFFLISDNMMAVIKNLLLESSNYFPNNQETVDGFSFGYLPASVYIA